MKVVDIKKSMQMEEHSWTVFVITKYLIYELQYDVLRLKNMKDAPLKPDEV
jgi:hypothetical protein